MLNQKEINQKLTELKPLLYQKYFVSRIGYFGFYPDEEESVYPDIHILVEFEKPLGMDFFKLKNLLEEALESKIDLVSTNALKKNLKENVLRQAIFI